MLFITYDGIKQSGYIPALAVSIMWWFTALTAGIVTYWREELKDRFDLHRRVPWIVDMIYGLLMCLFLCDHGWYFTGLAVVILMIFEELIYSTDFPEHE
jgi:hypothetical protein